MRDIFRFLAILAFLGLAVSGALTEASPAGTGSIVIVFKDGRQQTFPVADVARIEFKTPAEASTGLAPEGRGYFLGEWRVGDGAGSTFLIKLSRDGTATKSIGGTHGTWTVVDGEARISWEDGWHDAIRKAGNRYEKAAYEPGRTFSDDPSNVTSARRTHPEPI
jgi:hypothetical protein